MSASKRKNLNNMEVDNNDDSSSSDEDDDEPHPDAYRGNEVGACLPIDIPLVIIMNSCCRRCKWNLRDEPR